MAGALYIGGITGTLPVWTLTTEDIGYYDYLGTIHKV